MEKIYLVNESVNGKLEEGLKQHTNNYGIGLKGRIFEVGNQRYLLLRGAYDELNYVWATVLNPFNTELQANIREISEPEQMPEKKIVVKTYDLKRRGFGVSDQLTPVLYYGVHQFPIPDNEYKEILAVTGEEEDIDAYVKLLGFTSFPEDKPTELKHRETLTKEEFEQKYLRKHPAAELIDASQSFVCGSTL